MSESKTHLAFSDEESENATRETLERLGMSESELGTIIGEVNVQLARSIIRVCKSVFEGSVLNEMFKAHKKNFLGSMIITAAAVAQGRVLREMDEGARKDQVEVILKNIALQAESLSLEKPTNEKEVN